MKSFSSLGRRAWRTILDQLFRHPASSRRGFRLDFETLADRLAPAAITLPVPNGSVFFGNSVAMSGNNMLVGAYGTNGAKRAAYLFNTSGTLLKTLNDPRNNAHDYFGFALALSGHNVLLGASYANNTASNTGAAYLFNASGLSARTPVR